jgi:hypothetical protein
MNENNIPPNDKEKSTKVVDEFSMPKKKLGKGKPSIPIVNANEAVFFKISKD